MLEKITSASIFLLLFAFSFSKLANWDIWWHLKTGAMIMETGTIPVADVFTAPSQGAPWIDLHWGFQVLFAAIYRLLGGAGIILFQTALAVSTLWVVHRTYGTKRYSFLATGLLFLTVLTLSGRLLVRPEILSLLILAVILKILWNYIASGGESKPGRIALYCLPAIQVLWANTQGIFVLGLFAVWCFAVGEWLRAKWCAAADIADDRGTGLSSKARRRLFAVAVLSVVACFLNPYGMEGLLFPFTLFTRVSGQADIYSETISELLSPFDPRIPWTVSTISYLVLLALSGVSFVVKGKRMNPSHLLIWLGFAYLSFKSTRNINLFAVAAYPITLCNLKSPLGGLLERLDKSAKPFFKKAFLLTRVAMHPALLGIVLAAMYLTATNRLYVMEDQHRSFGLGAEMAFYPVETIDWIKKNRPQGPVFNHLGLGGYLIYTLYPQYRVFIDGRLEVHSQDLYIRYANVMDDPATHWEALEKDYQFGWAILSHSAEGPRRLIQYLNRQPDWQLTAVDQAAVVFVRKSLNPGFPDFDASGWSPPSARAADLPDFSGPLSGLERWIDHSIAGRIEMPFDLFSLGNLFMTLERSNQAASMFQLAISRAPDMAMLHNNLGLAYLGLEQWDDAVAAFTRAAELAPRNAMIQSNLGAAYGQMGAADKALAAFLKATTLDDDYEEAFGNLGAAYYQQNRLDEAAAAFERALALRPDFAQHYVALAVIYANKDDIKKAVQYAQKAKSLGHPGADALIREISQY